MDVKEFQYFAPNTLEEAIALLDRHKEKAVLMSGGTDIIVQLRENLISPDYIIDVKRIKELHGIRFSKEEGLFIGACATMNEIGTHEDVKKYYPFLASAVSTVGSRQIRHRATCVGNIVNASPLADSATPLYALDATVVMEGPAGKREVPIREFIVFVRKTSLAANEIVRGIKVPYIEGAKGTFHKNSRRKEVDLSTVCGTVLQIGDEYRLAFGSVAPTPVRLVKTEELLKGKALAPELIEEASELARTEVSPIDDVRSTKEYRYDAVSVIVRRGLKALAGLEA